MAKLMRLGLVAGVALFFITLVLRPPVASIGPLLDEISEDLALTPILTGLLASLPVLCFGLGAFASPWLVRRLGVNRGMLALLVVILLSTVLRLYFGYPFLLIGTVAAGLAIAMANVLLPTVVRERYPKQIALVTGMYTTVLAVSASFAAAVAVPSSEALGGWQSALLIWAAPALLAVIFWLPIATSSPNRPVANSVDSNVEASEVNRSALAWAIVGFFGIQSLGFYAILSWLPSMLIDAGLSPADAGGTLGLATAVGIPTAFILSSFISKFKTLAWWSGGASSITLAGFATLAGVVAAADNGADIDSGLLMVACVLIGLGQATTFPLSLTLISTRAASQSQTTQLSAMAQGWGYLLAAVGTFVVGVLSENTGSWLVSLFLLVFLTLAQVCFGFYAGRPGQIRISS